MKRNIGSFYFKRTMGNNLLGEFINLDSKGYTTESADLVIKSDSQINYIGSYTSSWIEGETSHFRNLEIKLKDESTNVFILEWSQKNGSIVFWGEAMLCDGILIGHYRNFDDVNS